MLFFFPMEKIITPLPPTLSIGALAKETGASVRSIRHYDGHGLLMVARAGNGYRTFPRAAVTQVRQIQRMIATGFSLAEIRAFPDCMLMIEGARSCSETTDAQRKRLVSIEKQISDLERRRARLLKTLEEGVVPPLDDGPRLAAVPFAGRPSAPVAAAGDERDRPPGVDATSARS
jgi:MerR family transcriptional regulator, copper efflux regulator